MKLKMLSRLMGRKKNKRTDSANEGTVPKTRTSSKTKPAIKSASPTPEKSAVGSSYGGSSYGYRHYDACGRPYRRKRAGVYTGRMNYHSWIGAYMEQCCNTCMKRLFHKLNLAVWIVTAKNRSMSSWLEGA